MQMGGWGEKRRSNEESEDEREWTPRFQEEAAPGYPESGYESAVAERVRAPHEARPPAGRDITDWTNQVADRTATGFRTTPLLPKYHDEETGGGWRATPNKAGGYDRTHYFDSEERERSKVSRVGDRRVQLNHQRRPQPSLSSEPDWLQQIMGTPASGEPPAPVSENAGWVMSGTGEMHTFDGGLVHGTEPEGRIFQHHSSPVGGEAVSGAGMLTVSDGHITQINDQSGHYRPTGEHTYQSVAHLGRLGLMEWGDTGDQHSTKVTFSGPDSPGMQPDAKPWIRAERGIMSGDLSLPYRAFMQTQGNEVQARYKDGTNIEMMHSNAASRLSPRPGRSPAAFDERGELTEGGPRPVDLSMSQTPPSARRKFD